ncbi:MAG: internal scaffolding protein [Microviridae sp.]|nr:MAG: internal scaffolding protein [Microviridae sp.]
MSKVFLRTPYNYDMNEASDASGLTCDDDSLAIQSAREESDINTIVKRFGLTGELPTDLQMPTSADVSGAPDFHTAMGIVRAAEEEFMRVPAEVRARFSNSPSQLVSFLDDESNRLEAIKLGFISPPPAVTITPPAPVSPPSS